MFIPSIKIHLLTGFIFIGSFLTACNSVQTRVEHADSISTQNNFHKKVIETELFRLVSYQKTLRPSETAVIYIEGDGLAWKNRYQVSANPTPTNPVALKLATIDTSPVVIYIARPCQFINLDTETNCNPQYWTNKRASQEVIESINTAIDKIKKKLNLNKIRLVAFSGGATIAAILAARRNDITDLRTVAGNLDIDKFVEVHKVTPLTGSVNPTIYASELIKIPQTHFVSDNDTVITRDISDSYLQKLKEYDANLKCIKFVELIKPEHNSGWDTGWASQDFQNIQTCKNQS